MNHSLVILTKKSYLLPMGRVTNLSMLSYVKFIARINHIEIKIFKRNKITDGGQSILIRLSLAISLSVLKYYSNFFFKFKQRGHSTFFSTSLFF